jgi:hypothetical protein
MATYEETILATSGLVAYWRLGEPSGTNVVDAFSTIDGTSSNCTVAQPGALAADADTAYAFNGTSSFINATNTAALQLTTGSVECWFNHDQAQGGFAWLLCKETAYSVALIDNELGFFDWGGGAVRNSAVTPTNGSWHHVVLAFESAAANGTFIYLDGTLVLTTTMTVSTQDNPLLIGAGQSGGGQFFDGLIDEVAIYDTKLSLATVQAHYNLGLNGPATGNRYNIFQLRPIGA